MDAFATFKVCPAAPIPRPRTARDLLRRCATLLGNYFGARLAVRADEQVHVLARVAARPGDELLHCVAPLTSRSLHLGEAGRAFSDALRILELHEGAANPDASAAGENPAESAATGIGAANPDASAARVAFTYRCLLQARTPTEEAGHTDFDALAELMGDHAARVAASVFRASIPIVCGDAVDDPVTFSPMAALGALHEGERANAVLYAYAENNVCYTRCVALRRIRAGERIRAHPLQCARVPDPAIVDLVRAAGVRAEPLLVERAPPFAPDDCMRRLVQSLRGPDPTPGFCTRPLPVSLHERREALFSVVARAARRFAAGRRVIALITADPECVTAIRRTTDRRPLLAAHNHLRELRKTLPDWARDRVGGALRELEREIKAYNPDRPAGYALVQPRKVESLGDCLARHEARGALRIKVEVA